MIKKIEIKNYKSVENVAFDLGRFNLLIGENGCGKSNVLEGIALAGAASAHKLDNEYFSNRGLRVTSPTFMRSAFGTDDDKIRIKVTDEKETDVNYRIKFDVELLPPRWVDEVGEIRAKFFKAFLKVVHDKREADSSSGIDYASLEKILKEDLNVFVDEKGNQHQILPTNELPELSSFIIYSLEESKLRLFDNSNSIYPFGRNGEGLFAYLKEISQDEKRWGIISEIKEYMDILDWYDDMEVPQNQMSQDFSIKIKDRYIDDSLNYFDQRSTNEGFLNLLFYLTLFISNDSPSFFAIDNIESSFNPKMCRKVVSVLTSLAEKHGKQVIATTHNPAVLDGMCLGDSERLFVVRRDLDGHTRMNRIESSASALPLSEAWMKGYIGGLPENF